MNEIGLREARKEIGPIADRARYTGEVTYLTRNGERIAAIVPLDRIKETTVQNTKRLAEQITPTLGDRADDFDISGIAELIGETFGFDVNIDDIPSEKYWDIVQKYDTTDYDALA